MWIVKALPPIKGSKMRAVLEAGSIPSLQHRRTCAENSTPANNVVKASALHSIERWDATGFANLQMLFV
jgi:hypothetical protein